MRTLLEHLASRWLSYLRAHRIQLCPWWVCTGLALETVEDCISLFLFRYSFIAKQHGYFLLSVRTWVNGHNHSIEISSIMCLYEKLLRSIRTRENNLLASGNSKLYQSFLPRLWSLNLNLINAAGRTIVWEQCPFLSLFLEIHHISESKSWCFKEP